MIHDAEGWSVGYRCRSCRRVYGGARAHVAVFKEFLSKYLFDLFAVVVLVFVFIAASNF